MCGISGIVNKDNSSVPASEIEAMNRVIVHRGPDGEGYRIGSNFAFGHRRLSVIDLSASAAQPMEYGGKYTIIYNGEIYNYIELRSKLQAEGQIFATDSDTEVILAAYGRYGYDCVNHFNGMWSFAIHDSSKDIIFCSRDRFGVKPFYFLDSPGRFAFGSEIKQLLGFCSTRKANRKILADYLIAGLDDHTDKTFFEGIRKLPQSHNLIYDLRSHVFTMERYYTPSIDRSLSSLSEDDAARKYGELLKDSVRLRLRSDVKVGTCLSGGIDSSSVASIASPVFREASGEKFSAVTACSTQAELDESGYASLVAESAGLDWHTVTPETHEFAEDIDNLVTIQEEPFGSPSLYMQYRVFKTAREKGCTVMLDGQGGDETMLGYERYYPALLLSSGIIEGTRLFFSSWMKSRLTLREMLFYLFYFTIPGVRIKRLRKRFSFVTDELFSCLDKEALQENAACYRDIGKLQLIEITRMQLPHLLKYEDRNSMIHSVESRLPFLDYRLVETALSLNNSLKIKDGWTKYILRKAVSEVIPPDIAWRRDKLGFNAPEKSWLSAVDDQMLETIRNSEILKSVARMPEILELYHGMDLRVKWRLFNIAKWEEAFSVGI